MPTTTTLYFLLLLLLPLFYSFYQNNSSTMSAANASFLSSLISRRSIYVLSKSLPTGVTQSKIQELVNQAVKYTPSSFNIESARVVVLWGEESDKLWELTWKSVEAVAGFPDDAAKAASKGKIQNFATGAGTVLFFEDQDVIDKIASIYTAYADNFPIWAENSNGLLQGNIWTLFSNEKVGASLQHYSNLIEGEVAKTWGLPASWKLKAQMPFGGIGAPAEEKEKTFEGRVKYFGGESA
ncbi:Nitroreductase-like protein [Mrakia frigida]|uniref:Nitroreductase-like protein n=1 Tax=Mrakia frigida TaxID=29902 RepID=UPI003FCC1FE9